MKLLYITNPWMADSDFPLIRAYQQKRLDVTVLILMSPNAMAATLFNIKNGLSKTIIVPSAYFPELRLYSQYMDMSKVYILNITSNKAHSWSYIKSTFLMKKFIKEGGYDLVHAINFLGIERKKLYLLVRPWITTVHDPIPHSSNNRNRQKKDRVREVVLELSDGVVLLNGRQEKEFCKRYRVSPDKVFINQFGVYDYMKFFLPKDRKCNPYNVLFFGRIQTYKGLEYLCEAMQIVRKSVSRATLTIAGSGKIYFDIEPYLKQGFVNLVNRYITMEELADSLSGCALCVCPYTDATQSGVIMTAFSLAVPVVATNVGGLSEMIEDGKNGVLVPPKDPEALAEAIVSLLLNQQRLKEMSRNIETEYFRGNKSWSFIADKYIDYYKSLINKS